MNVMNRVKEVSIFNGYIVFLVWSRSCMVGLRKDKLLHLVDPVHCIWEQWEVA